MHEKKREKRRSDKKAKLMAWILYDYKIHDCRWQAGFPSSRDANRERYRERL